MSMHTPIPEHIFNMIQTVGQDYSESYMDFLMSEECPLPDDDDDENTYTEYKAHIWYDAAASLMLYYGCNAEFNGVTYISIADLDAAIFTVVYNKGETPEEKAKANSYDLGSILGNALRPGM